MLRQGAPPAPVGGVPPVDTKQVGGLGGVGIDVGQGLSPGGGDGVRIGQLGKRRQAHSGGAESAHAGVVDAAIDDLGLKSQTRHAGDLCCWPILVRIGAGL